jgi:hypothetical protein
MTIRVLVADDQSMVRAGFRMLPAGFVLKDDSGDAPLLRRDASPERANRDALCNRAW